MTRANLLVPIVAFIAGIIHAPHASLADGAAWDGDFGLGEGGRRQLQYYAEGRMNRLRAFPVIIPSNLSSKYERLSSPDLEGPEPEEGSKRPVSTRRRSRCSLASS